MHRKYVGYCKESMRGGDSNEKQEAAIRRHVDADFGKLLQVYRETASGNSELMKALAYCQRMEATLLLSKFERLCKDIPFLTAVEQSAVDFAILDFALANRDTIGVIIKLAHYERFLLQKRTAAAIQAKVDKESEFDTVSRFANPANISREVAMLARQRGLVTKRKNADNFAFLVGPVAKAYHEDGATLGGIAKRFNDDHVLMASGKSGKWTATAVKNLLARYTSLERAKSPERPVTNDAGPKFGL